MLEYNCVFCRILNSYEVNLKVKIGQVLYPMLHKAMPVYLQETYHSVLTSLTFYHSVTLQKLVYDEKGPSNC